MKLAAGNSLRNADRFKLRFGPYRTRRFRCGSIKRCEMQGDVRIIGISDGRIPWPVGIRLGRRGGGRGFVLNADLAKAVRREAGIAIAFWWGVRPDTVSRWRRALGVGRSTKRSHARWSANTREPWSDDFRLHGIVQHALVPHWHVRNKPRWQRRRKWGEAPSSCFSFGSAGFVLCGLGKMQGMTRK